MDAGTVRDGAGWRRDGVDGTGRHRRRLGARLGSRGHRDCVWRRRSWRRDGVEVSVGRPADRGEGESERAEKVMVRKRREWSKRIVIEG